MWLQSKPSAETARVKRVSLCHLALTSIRVASRRLHRNQKNGDSEVNFQLATRIGSRSIKKHLEMLNQPLSRFFVEELFSISTIPNVCWCFPYSSCNTDDTTICRIRQTLSPK